MKILYDAIELKKSINRVKKCTADTRQELSRIYFHVFEDGTTKVTSCNGYMFEALLIYGKAYPLGVIDFSIPAAFSIPAGEKQVIVEKVDEESDVVFFYPALGYSSVFKNYEKGREFIDSLEFKITPKGEEACSVLLEVKMMIEAINSATSGCNRMSKPCVRVRFYKEDEMVTFEPLREKEGQKTFLLKIRD